jgi:thiopeptide-type bacteriocin biosynthesis protein
MLGRPELIDGEVRSAIESRLPALLAGGLVRSHEFAQYQREWDRYGGPSGMLVCEQIFRYDAALCLTILALEQTADSPKSRRELSLLFTERFLDLFGMTDGDRKAFHEYAYSWTLRQQEWGAEELAALERKFLQIESGLRAALARVRAGDRMAWGSLQLADAVERALGASAPQVERLLELRRGGELSAHLTPLIWSLTHMHCNRLGIDAHAEAIVRYFSGRLFGPSTAMG